MLLLFVPLLNDNLLININLISIAVCGKSDTNVEEQDSEDDGPPPGWDSKCQPEQKLQMTCSSGQLYNSSELIIIKSYFSLLTTSLAY